MRSWARFHKGEGTGYFSWARFDKDDGTSDNDCISQQEPFPLSFFEEHADTIKSSEITRKYKDKLVVHGYMRECSDSNYLLQFPLDVMNLCLNWYHVKKCYLFIGGDCLEIDENKNSVTHIGEDNNSCYGSLIMPSISRYINIDYEYKLFISNNCHEISIGIDDSKCKHINDNFSGKHDTKNYAYAYDSKKYNWNNSYGLKYGKGYTTMGEIRMVYNPYRSRLQFWNNSEYQGLIENIGSGKELSYRLCIYMGNKIGTSVTLCPN